MKKILIIFAAVFFTSAAQASDIQLLNPEFLGQPSSNAVKLLYDKKSGEIEPSIVTAEIKCGKYNASSVFYPEEVTFAQARRSLNKLYKDYENNDIYQEDMLALWKIEKKQFIINLVQEERNIRIMYIQFQSTEAVMKGIMESTGADMNTPDNDTCKE